jgi:hypothetical protein
MKARAGRRSQDRSPAGLATQIALPFRPCQHPDLVRRIWLLRAVVLGCVGLAPVIAAGQTPAPPASLDDVPSAKREDVTRLLRKVRQRHGDDAVVIQTHLLLNAMQKGSILATGVRVDRVEESLGKRYLGFDLETGMVFDDATRDQEARLQVLWGAVLEPTLARLEDGLQVAKADGIMVQMQYHHRPYRTVAELRRDIEERPGTAEVARFYVLAADLDAVVRKQMALAEVLPKSRITVDGAERSVRTVPVSLPLTPGPD